MLDAKESLVRLGAKENVPMRDMTTFRIGGNAELFFEPNDLNALMDALHIAKDASLPVTIIGNGSNLLVSDFGVEGLVLRVGDGMASLVQNGEYFTAGAGILMSALCKGTVDAGFMGLEWGAGIPGRLGGAIAMNAGAHGFEIKPLLSRVDYIEDGEFRSAVPSEDDMGYRKSVFCAPGRIVVCAVLKLFPDDGGARERMARYLQKRKEKQPLSHPSAGSVFKRPQGDFAGALIERAGLKGTRVGGAEVSALHAGFIVNTGGATCADVLELIHLIQTRVFQSSNIMLEPEIRFIGKKEGGYGGVSF